MNERAAGIVYLLADAGVTGQHVGVLQHGLVGWGVRLDLEDAAPLGESSATFLVLGTTLRQTVQTCSWEKQK